MDVIRLGRNSYREPDDDLSITRAAAMAWHQRSSSRDHPTALLRPRRFHLRRPSRYLLEALRSAAADVSKKPESHSSLLDFHEIEQIARELERFIIRAAAGGDDQAGGHRRKAVGRAAAVAKGIRGFVLRQAAAFCGSGGAVVPERRRAAGGVAAGRKGKGCNYVN